LTSIIASKVKRPKGQLIRSFANTVVCFIHIPSCNSETGSVVFNSLEFQDRKLTEYLPFFSSVKNVGLKGGKILNSVLPQQQAFQSFRKSCRMPDMSHLFGRK